MIDTEISNTFLESSDIVLSLVPDQNWYLKVDQISPTLFYTELEKKSFFLQTFGEIDFSVAFEIVSLTDQILFFPTTKETYFCD